MTRKEIIDGLKFTIEMFLLDPSTGKTLTEPRNDMDEITIDACKSAIELLEQESTADVVERKKGEWILNEESGIYECKNCGYVPSAEGFLYFNFCPNCGADMRGE